MFWTNNGTTDVSTTFLTDVVSVITETLTILMSEPIVYFVMLGLVGASIKLVKKISKR